MNKDPESRNAARGRRPTKTEIISLQTQLARDRDVAEKRIAELQARTKSLEQELTNARLEAGVRIHSLETELARSTERFQEVEENLARSKEREKTTEAERDEARLKISQSESQMRSLEEELGRLKDESGPLRLERDKARIRASQFEVEHRRLEEDLARSKEGEKKSEAERDEARQKLSQSEEEQRRLQAQIEEARGLEGRLAALRRDRDEAGARILTLEESLARSKAEAETRMAALQAELEEARRAVQERSAELKAALRKVMEFDEKGAALERRIEEGRTGREAAERRISELESEVARSKEAEAKARAEAERLNSETQRQEATRKTQEGRLDELRRSLADLAGKIEAAAPEVRPAPAPISAPLPPAPGIDELFADPPPNVPAAPEPEVAAPPSPAEASSIIPAEASPNPTEADADPNAIPAEVTAAAAKAENLFGPPGDNGELPYVLLEILFRDAMGGVYRAFDRRERRWCAVRFVAGQADEAQTAVIEKEVQRLIGLPHPHLLPTAATGRRQDHLYVVMALSEAAPLARTKIPEVSRICRIVRDCAEALHYAHEEGLFHGDLNPENILVESREGGDHALVKELGLGYTLETVVLRAASNRPDLMIRNPAYIPPEQTQDAKRTLDVAGDVYALGATLYATLAGKPPFEGKDIRQVRSRVMMMEPPPIETLRPDVPPGLAVVVRRAMAKERAVRYASANELAEALTRFLEGAGTRVRVNPNYVPPPAKSKA